MKKPLIIPFVKCYDVSGELIAESKEPFCLIPLMKVAKVNCGSVFDVIELDNGDKYECAGPYFMDIYNEQKDYLGRAIEDSIWCLEVE